MRIVFMGTPDFSVPCLQALIDDGHDVCAVFTQRLADPMEHKENL